MSRAEEFLQIIRENQRVVEVLHIAEQLGLPDWYLTAGCLFETVWNVLSGHVAQRGILDYDLFYFEGDDLSWEAEDAVIRRVPDPDIEVRNEARVHIWYPEKFGVPCPPYADTRAAIGSFAAVACCVGVTVRDGRTEVYAPYGLDDLFGMALRPNPVLAPREVYETKAARWAELWPLTVLPWPSG